jgi:hypothetical protein
MKLFIAVSNSQSHIPSDFFWTFMNMRKTCPMVIKRGTEPWDMVRNNVLIEMFLQSDCDVFTRMDVDQTYPSNYLEVMLPLVKEYKAIGPMICDRFKHNNFMPLAFDNLDSGRNILFDLKGKTGVVEVPCPHTNLFFAREVMENVSPPWFFHVLNDRGTGVIDHADRRLIRNIREAGYKTYLNLDVNLTHVSYQNIDREYHKTWVRGTAK